MSPALEPSRNLQCCFTHAAARHLTPDSFVSLGDKKPRPRFSYPKLIKMAISQAPNRRLSLAKIYEWISDNFAFYDPSERRWKNSIRCNLTTNRAFVREELRDGDSRKRSYWKIQPGMECQTTKCKARHASPLTSPHIPDMPSNTPPRSTHSFVREHRRPSYPSILASSPAAEIQTLPKIERYIPSSRPTSFNTLPSRTSSHKRILHQGPFGRQARRVQFLLPPTRRRGFARGCAEEEIARLRRSQLVEQYLL